MFGLEVRIVNFTSYQDSDLSEVLLNLSSQKFPHNWSHLNRTDPRQCVKHISKYPKDGAK